MTQHIIHRIRRNRFVRDVSVLVFGSGFGHLVGVAALPVLTRLYAPEGFGVLATYMAILVPVTVLSSLRYEALLPLPADDETAHGLMGVAFMVLLVVTAGAAAFVVLFGGWVAAALKVDGLESSLAWLPAGVFTAGAFRILVGWGVRERDYHAIARTKFVRRLVQAVGQCALGLVAASGLGLVIGQTLGEVAGTGAYLGLDWRPVRQIFRRCGPRQLA